MKKITLLILLMISLSVNAQSDSNNKVYFSPDAKVTYRLFKTQNMHIFIKLNTSNGTMKLVQFSTSTTRDMMQVDLNDIELATGADAKSGRFYLYPTENFYTFLLIDQIDGRIWQVQWSTDPDNCGILRIY
jgi:hypothetical protein